jgi:uncharacterized protein (TIGR02246 family)
MPAHKPEECDLLIAEYVNTGNLDAAVELYEPGATFVTGPGKTITGQAAIREALEGMLAGKPRLTMKVPIVVQNVVERLAEPHSLSSSRFWSPTIRST